MRAWPPPSRCSIAAGARHPRAHTGEEGKGKIQVVIRHLAEGMPDQHLVLDATPIKAIDAMPDKMETDE